MCVGDAGLLPLAEMPLAKRRAAFTLALVGAISLLLSITACSITGLAGAEDKTLLAERSGRPTELFIPPGYDSASPVPLVILLHGFALDGKTQDTYLQIKTVAMERGMLFARPNGTRDAAGQRFWNASAACCNFLGATTDDRAYIMGLIEEVQVRYSVDTDKIYLIGYSNGGFLAHSLACEQSGTIAAIVSIAGALDAEGETCAPQNTVRVLQVHGTADLTILYPGGYLFNSHYTGARKTADRWAELNGCSPEPEPAYLLDLEAGIIGPETQAYNWRNGCRDNALVELWKINAASHAPLFNTRFNDRVFDFLAGTDVEN